ncbi:Gfo/Idh/MocA family protein [Dactylosporangium sp. CA-139114]|uniref:Gfo/Idh/MocA family protein n=1 Tax=Dactylosporangium sp. CA-139114 TaxID=3239931 RepID=UPI003D99D405
MATRGALPGFAPPGSPAADRAVHFLDFGGAPGARLVAVADPDAAQADRAAADFGARHVLPDGDALLDRVPVDLVAVCTPPHLHARYARQALGAGVHVLLEKPGATSVAELDELLAARAARPDLTCVVNLPWRYHPAVEALRQVLAAGEIGPVERLRVVFEHTGPQAWSPAAWYRSGPGSGVVADLAGHALSVARAVLGGPIEAITVGPGSAERARASARVRTAGGAVLDVDVEVGWDAPTGRFEITATGAGGSARTNLIVPGATRSSEVEVTPAGGAPRTTPATWEKPGDALDRPATDGAYRAVIRAVRTGETAPTDIQAVADVLRHALHWAEALDRAPAVRG